MPSSRVGRLAGVLLALAIVLFAAFFGLVAAGQRGGDTFFSNAALATAILSAAASAVAAGCAGIAALVRHDRSPLVIASITAGAFVVWWATAEIVFPH